MKYKVGDKVRVKRTLSAASRYGGVLVNTDMAKRGGEIVTITKIYDDGYNISGDHWFWSDEMLEPADNIVRMADGTIIGDFSTGGFCDGFRGGKIPASGELIVSRTEMERTMDKLLKVIEKYSIKKEEKNLKFTFYVTDWVDINKTNGEKIPMKRTVAYIGSNTDIKADTSCPAAEYDERIGCLIAAAKISAKRSTEAKMMYNIARGTWGTELSWAIFFELANSAFNGNFDRAYKKFHNDNIRFEKKRLTCTYCGKVFDTVEEKQAEEAWHVERKKARRECYLLRKRAKEIAFEEQAQKMAKEMMDTEKGAK